MFPLCDGLRLLLSMAIDGPIARNHRSVGTPLEDLETDKVIIYLYQWHFFIVLDDPVHAFSFHKKNCIMKRMQNQKGLSRGVAKVDD